jgi:hypothetical protein
MTYRVHRFDIKMTEDQMELEKFLNGLTGEVVSIIPNVNSDRPGWFSYVDFLMIVEKLN